MLRMEWWSLNEPIGFWAISVSMGASSQRS
jgi:hypothetical protein